MKGLLSESAVLQGFERFKGVVDQKLQAVLPLLGSRSSLIEACEYALMSGGKRFRPAIVFMVAEALKKGRDVTEAALAVEFLHTASLIVDDLPCMDNDDRRRDHSSLHKVYGEAIALLTSYALLVAGYEFLEKNGSTIKHNGLVSTAEGDRICALAVQSVSQNSGFAGACAGQLYDLFPPELSKETIADVIQKKTVTLFEIAFVIGWLYGGGDVEKLEGVKRLAYHFGVAFQIADDLEDISQDAENQRQINMAAFLGEGKAKELFFEEIEKYRAGLKVLGIDSEELQGLATILSLRVNPHFSPPLGVV